MLALEMKFQARLTWFVEDLAAPSHRALKCSWGADRLMIVQVFGCVESAGVIRSRSGDYCYFHFN